MIKISLSLTIVIVLTGCQAAQQRDASYCNSIGATGNMYAQCMMQREDVRMSRSRAFGQFGNTMLQAGQAPAPAMRTTTCRNVSGTLICNSF